MSKLKEIHHVKMPDISLIIEREQAHLILTGLQKQYEFYVEIERIGANYQSREEQPHFLRNAKESKEKYSKLIAYILQELETRKKYQQKKD